MQRRASHAVEESSVGYSSIYELITIHITYNSK